MSKENTAGLGVNNRYGPLATPNAAAGNFKTEGAYNELVIEFSGANINDDDVSGFLPAGAKPVEWALEVKSVFALGGTTPVINFGTDGSETTNGLEISEAQAEAVGTYVSTTFAGTWQSRLAADTTVSVVLDGTSPTVTSAGEGRLVIRYIKT